MDCYFSKIEANATIKYRTRCNSWCATQTGESRRPIAPRSANVAYHAKMMTRIMPIVTGDRMAAVDRAMVERCGLELMQVMETAGRAVAVVTRSLWKQVDDEKPVVILCGSGGNGGDGFVCGRYLHGWGIPVECWSLRPASSMSGLANHQLDVCRRIGMTVREPDGSPEFDHAGLIVDGLFGFGLASPPRDRAAELISAANNAGCPIIAIDVPSGIDSSTGIALEPAIVATLTVTLGLPKQGLVQNAGPAHAGRVIVADIGIPAVAYQTAGIPETDCFRDAEFVDLQGIPWRPEGRRYRRGGR